MFFHYFGWLNGPENLVRNILGRASGLVYNFSTTLRNFSERRLSFNNLFEQNQACISKLRSLAVNQTDFKQIKEQIAQNNPVILPAAGRELKNPNFKAPGPLYHMLVVRGWLSDGRIITNDPGTRRGEGYIYDKSVLWDAIHDWNGGNVASGQKVMIVVK